MIIYASRLDLVDADPRIPIRDALHGWLSRKVARKLARNLLQSGHHDLGRGHQLTVEDHDTGNQWAFSCRYSHPDSEVRGRTWYTEVGIASDSGKSFCTVLLRTDEQSALVDARPETTRPGVVEGIRRACKLRGSTPGGTPRALTGEDAIAFLSVARDAARLHPIVQISHRPDGRALIDPRRMADLCLGIADVVVIPPEVDTFALAREIGGPLCPFDGAANILWPVVCRWGEPFVPATRLLPDDVLGAAARGLLPERELLARICHYVNPRLARDHVSVEQVRSQRLHSALAIAKAGSTPREDPELAALIEQVDSEQRQQISELGQRVSALERDIKAVEEERDEARLKAAALEGHLNAKGSEASGETASAALRDCILRVVNETPSLEDSLVLLSELFPSRLVVLPTAWQSAREASGFRYADRAFELLRTLCTGYYEAMVSGSGDKAASQVFGQSSFAARESESVENNKRARALRTFVYKGEAVAMMRHLKIGVKDSISETFRAHFHWDAKASKVVLGHCGRHLDHG